MSTRLIVGSPAALPCMPGSVAYADGPTSENLKGLAEDVSNGASDHDDQNRRKVEEWLEDRDHLGNGSVAWILASIYDATQDPFFKTLNRDKGLSDISSDGSLINQPENAYQDSYQSHCKPRLARDSSSIDESIYTADADIPDADIPRHELQFDHDEGVLMSLVGPTFNCLFWFLPCEYETSEISEWLAHCNLHLQGKRPPRFVCPICGKRGETEDNLAAWKWSLLHLSEHQIVEGRGLRSDRLLQVLIQYLWAENLIKRAKYAELCCLKSRHVPNPSSSEAEDELQHMKNPEKLPDAHNGDERSVGEHEQDHFLSYHSSSGRGDSGYGSRSNTLHGGSGKNREDDECSVRTMLSDASLVFQAPQERESLISAFVKDFSNDVEIAALTDHQRSRLADQLSDLLKAFSISLESTVSTQGERDAKDFIRQQRDRITKHVRSQNDASVPADSVVLSALPQREMSVEEKLLQWDKVPLSSVPDTEEDSVEIPPRYQDVRSFLRGSAAYVLLIQRLQAAARLTNQTEGAIVLITQQVSSSLASMRSRKHPGNGLFTAEVTLAWELTKFLKDEEFDVPLNIALEQAITITGDLVNAQALTWGEYLEQVWPQTGRKLVKAFTMAISSEERQNTTSHQINGMKLQIKLLSPKVLVLATGNQAALTELCAQLAWLSSALQNSPKSLGPCRIEPFVEEMHQPFEDNRDHPDQTLAILMNFRYNWQASAALGASHGTCWHGMFRNPTIVTGFPIMARDLGERGLQISFDVMHTIAETHFLTQYDGKVLLKGHCTMLVPTQRTSDSVLWHFLHNADGKRIPHFAFKRSKVTALTKKELLIDDIEKDSLRHFVGWAPTITRHFGTKDCRYDIIDWSGVQKCTSGLAIEQKLTISASRYVGVSAAVTKGNRDRPQHVKQPTYSMQMESARKIPVLLYDTASHSAWLVDGASALLHTTRTQVAREPYGGINSLFNDLQFNDKSFDHPSSCDGPNAALSALKNENNMKHKILREFDSYADEKLDANSIHGSKGSDTGSSANKARESPQEIYKTTCFKELVSQTWKTLESIYDNQLDLETDHAFKEIQNPFSDMLEGYEFMGIVEGKRRLTRRGLVLSSNSKAWLEMVKRLHVVTLFGENFGHLYQPSETSKGRLCQVWLQVPIGQGYMTAPISLLNEIKKNSIEEGEVDAKSQEIMEGISWYPTKEIFHGCDRNCSHHILGRVQCLSLKGKQKLSTAAISTLPTDGAVIFGENSILNMPRVHSNLQLACHEKSNDSGLGSSIQTSASSAHDVSSSSSSGRPLAKCSIASPTTFSDSSSQTIDETSIQIAQAGISSTTGPSASISSIHPSAPDKGAGYAAQLQHQDLSGPRKCLVTLTRLLKRGKNFKNKLRSNRKLKQSLSLQTSRK